MQIQRIIHALPPVLRRHKLIRALAMVDPSSRVQLIRFNEGAQAYVDVGEGPFRTVMIAGEFDHEYFRVAGAFLDGGGVCFDVGANAGLCSFGLIPRCPKVEYHLFEANPRLWPLLRRSMALHSDVAIKLCEAAVGERSAMVRLDPQNPDQDIGQAFISEKSGVETRMITIDEYVRSSGVARVDFAKMDIEGYEYFAIDGARESAAAGKLPVVYFELKGPLLTRYGKSVFDVIERFRSLGYDLYHVRDQDFGHVTAPRNLVVRGLRVAAVTDYPEKMWTDLLAIHSSAKNLVVPAP